MVRSKQQALMFLLGAVIVGGVLGFSADRVVSASKAHGSWAQRSSMYDELGVSGEQRIRIDSMLDESSCMVDSLFKPLKPAMDSLMARRKADWLALLTPDQRTKFTAREARFNARKDSALKTRAADRAAHPRCGGPPRPGMGGGPGPRGPGGPFY